MNQHLNNPSRVATLALRSLEGLISEEERRELAALLVADASARTTYYDSIAAYIGLNFMGILSELDAADSAFLDQRLWEALSESEKSAPAVPVDKPSDRPLVVPIERIQREKTVYRFNKVSFYTAIASLAALVFLLVFIRFAPITVPRDVATLTDSLNAQWDESGGPLKNGMRLMTNVDPILLRKGIVQILFDNNARVTIEGPAEFGILDNDRLKLNYGRVYAAVPQEAMGFSVVTPNALIIDLGTEFGVQADLYGSTELHVLQGRTTLVAGQSTDKVSLVVDEGAAKRILRSASEVVDITLDEQIFARHIDSQTNFVWRGEAVFDLAGLVGGGSGFGTGQIESAIDPLTGTHGMYRSLDRRSDGRYVPVEGNPYIDGVFVPQGAHPQTVSSAGHIFEECPPTNGVYYVEIIYGSGRYLVDYQPDEPLGQLGGKVYGTPDYPSLFMHANTGITFDLDAIRSAMPGIAVAGFTAEAGLSSRAPRLGNADFWVLVDGQVRFSRRHVRDKGQAFDIAVPLNKTDRFLTLVTTDGGDVDRPGTEFGLATDSDWCVFARPALELIEH